MYYIPKSQELYEFMTQEIEKNIISESYTYKDILSIEKKQNNIYSIIDIKYNDNAIIHKCINEIIMRASKITYNNLCKFMNLSDDAIVYRFWKTVNDAYESINYIIINDDNNKLANFSIYYPNNNDYDYQIYKYDEFKVMSTFVNKSIIIRDNDLIFCSCFPRYEKLFRPQYLHQLFADIPERVDLFKDEDINGSSIELDTTLTIEQLLTEYNYYYNSNHTKRIMRVN